MKMAPWTAPLQRDDYRTGGWSFPVLNPVQIPHGAFEVAAPGAAGGALVTGGDGFDDGGVVLQRLLRHAAQRLCDRARAGKQPGAHVEDGVERLVVCGLGEDGVKRVVGFSAFSVV